MTIITRGTWNGPLCSQCGVNNPACCHGFYDKKYPPGSGPMKNTTPEQDRASGYANGYRVGMAAERRRTSAVVEALRAMVVEHDDASEFRPQDASCPICTEGMVPPKYNKGPCPYHRALAALRIWDET